MKKITFLVTMFFLVAVIALSFVGCDVFSKDNENISGQVVEASKTMTLGVNNIREVAVERQPTLIYSFRDDDNYYYFFDLGRLNNVPLADFDDVFTFENRGQTASHKFVINYTEESSIVETTSSIVENTVKLEENTSAKVGVEFGEKDVFKVSAEYAFSKSKSTSNTNSLSKSYEKASKYTNGKTIETTMNFDKNAQDGLYSFALTGSIEVYALVGYDLKTKQYVVEYFNEILKYWTDFYYFATRDEFVSYEYDHIDFAIPDNLPTPTDYKNLAGKNYNPIALKMERFNCNDGNQYNKEEQEESADWRSRHNGYELGELIIYGCEKDNNTFVIGNKSEFSIKYHLLQNTYALPLNGASAANLENDSETKVRGTNIDSRIGYGAYWLRITYSDNTQQEINATNQFYNRDANTYVELLNNSKLTSEKTILKIEVVVVYEIFTGGPGAFGIWWKEYTNWRCEFTFEFQN